MTATITTDVFTEQGHPAWRVAGPLGIVVYRSHGARLQLEPLGRFVTVPSVAETAGVALAAATGTDDDVYALLTRWYNTMPGMRAPTPPATGGAEIDRWNEMCGAELEAAILAATWYAHAGDLVGGWCVTVVDKPPSSGAVEVGSFLGEDVARHVAELHNEHVRNEELRAADRARMAEILAARPDVQPGDVIDTPAGADSLYATRRRMRVERVRADGIGGHLLLANGQPRTSRSLDATPDGYMGAYLFWRIAEKSTVIRDGVTIYTPEGSQ